jgi:hypothetical protein
MQRFDADSIESGNKPAPERMEARVNLSEFFRSMEEDSPEITEAISKMPPDVQAVVADFKKDYLAAMRNFKEAWLSAFSWAMQARDQLSLLKSYLEAEQLRSQLNLDSDAPVAPVEASK